MINELDKVFVQTKFFFAMFITMLMLMLTFINVNNVDHNVVLIMPILITVQSFQDATGVVRFPDFLNLMANKVCVKVVKGDD